MKLHLCWTQKLLQIQQNISSCFSKWEVKSCPPGTSACDPPLNPDLHTSFLCWALIPSSSTSFRNKCKINYKQRSCNHYGPSDLFIKLVLAAHLFKKKWSQKTHLKCATQHWTASTERRADDDLHSNLPTNLIANICRSKICRAGCISNSNWATLLDCIRLSSVAETGVGAKRRRSRQS